MALRKFIVRLRGLPAQWARSHDTGFVAIIKIFAQRDLNCVYVALSCDISARESFCDFYRGQPGPIGGDHQLLVLSTFYLRRLQTNVKLLILSMMTLMRRRELVVLSTDGLAGASFLVRPWKLTLVSQWFNSPDEADEYWARLPKLLVRTKRVELFPERPGMPDLPATSSLVRKSCNLVLAEPSRLDDHFPSRQRIVFAGDLTVDLRSGALPLISRTIHSLGQAFDLDDCIWNEARLRVDGKVPNEPLDFDVLVEKYAGVQFKNSGIIPSEIELDALRLTLHGRERLLYIRALAQSDLADFLVIVGHSWEQIPDLRRFISDHERFPVGKNVQDLQRSRVAPDFGSTLGSMPLYGRAQTLSGRAIGLLQRRDPRGNPLLRGLEDRRTFVSATDLIDRCRDLLFLNDVALKNEERTIRSNYLNHMQSSKMEFLNLIGELSR